jgi:hypothetical protein
MAFHVLFETLAMAYILFETHSAPAIVNIFTRMHFAHNSIHNISFENTNQNPLCFSDHEKFISMQFNVIVHD